MFASIVNWVAVVVVVEAKITTIQMGSCAPRGWHSPAGGMQYEVSSGIVLEQQEPTNKCHFSAFRQKQEPSARAEKKIMA